MLSDEAYSELVKRGQEWAALDHVANLLETTLKTVFAQMSIKHLDKGSAVKAEMYAMTEQVYQDHILAMCEARKKANMAKVMYQSVQTLTDLRRTEAANSRAELRQLGGK